MNLVEEKEALFDDKFNCISTDMERMKRFCDELKTRSGIQVCNHSCMTYEYIRNVYNSVVKSNEV